MTDEELDSELFIIGHTLLFASSPRDRYEAFIRMKPLWIEEWDRRNSIGNHLNSEGLDPTRQQIARTQDEALDPAMGRRALVELAKSYLRAEQLSLRKAICDEKQKYLDALASDRHQLLATLTDICATIFVGIPPAVAATFIIKIGIRRLCEEEPFGPAVSQPLPPPTVRERIQRFWLWAGEKLRGL